MLGCGVSIQVLQDYYKSHADVTVGPPRPLVTGESYQELEDRLTSGLESFTDGAPFTLQRFCEVSESNFISFLSKRMLYDDICAIQIKLVSQVQLGNEVYGDIGNFVP